MKIIKILRNKLYLENLEIIDINKDIEYRYSLKNDMNIEKIYEKIIFDSMLAKSIYLISIKERTSYEIRQKLSQKYLRKEIIYKVLKKLNDLNLLDDYNFADRYIKSNIYKGENKVKVLLLQKGISLEIINELIDNIKNDKEYFKIQKEQILKIVSLNKEKSKEKIISKLINRGYNFSIINEVLKEVKDVYFSYEK